MKPKTPKFVLALILALTSGGLCADGLEEGFRAPPPSARPQVWWHWMNGNVSKAGITADLEAMKEIGIGGAHIIDVDYRTPEGPIRFNTPAWFDHVRWAAREAKRLGLELGMANCSGFSSSGGPWVTPADSMKRLVWMERRVSGPCNLKDRISPPAETHGFYRDVATLAFRAPAAVRLKDLKATITCTVGDRAVNTTSLTDGDLDTGVAFGRRRGVNSPEPLCVTIDLGKPFAAPLLGICLDSGGWSATCPVTVEVSDDGAVWRTILERKMYTRLSGKVDGMLRNLALPDEPSRFYRVWIRPGATPDCQLREIDLGRWGGLSDLPVKTFHMKSEHAQNTVLSDMGWAGTAETVPLDGVIDLSNKLSPDGLLDWKVPPGEWRILRVGCAAIGKKTLPTTPGGAGLETDKLDASATRRHFNAYMGQLLKELGPLADVLDTMLIDSYEVGPQNWTVGLERLFRERFGYSLVPYLPVFAGYVVKSLEASENALADFRRLVADLFAKNYAGEMARLCHAHGLTLSLEPHGDCPTDDLQYGQDADINIGNFWAGSVGNVTPDREKLVSSIAHVWGRRYVGSEAFTAASKGWLQTPFTLKASGDRAYCMGINRVIYHRYAHQPWTKPTYVPGMTMGPCGMHFERTQTWWRQAKDWVTYESRCQHLLQEGQFVADVAVFCGEEAPNSIKGWGLLPRGYDFDGCATAAVKAMRADNGDIVLPSGMRYRMLAVPESRRTSPKMTRTLENLKAAGVTVVTYDEVKNALIRKGITPDFTCENDDVAFIHRRYGGGADGYFVAWPKRDPVTLQCSFRQTGRIPELWNPETGEIMRAEEWKMSGDRTEVTLELDPCGSVFVMFRKAADGLRGESNRRTWRLLSKQAIATDWSLSFPAGWNAPEHLALDKLVSWTELPEDGARYFSGTATYTRRIALDAVPAPDERTMLDLGTVKEIAEVEINGQSYPTLWKPPFRIDVTEAARKAAGVLDVTVKVTNLWPNRLIGDERLPPHNEWQGQRIKDIPEWVKRGEKSPNGRFTFTTWHHWTKDDKLLPSGLLGPVAVRHERTPTPQSRRLPPPAGSKARTTQRNFSVQGSACR